MVILFTIFKPKLFEYKVFFSNLPSFGRTSLFIYLLRKHKRIIFLKFHLIYCLL